MKIRKTIQGSIPSNKVYNSYNEDKHNVYSTEYLNDKLVCVSTNEPTNKQEVWIRVGKNLFHDGLIDELANMTYANGTASQYTADTNSHPNWKCQSFKDKVYLTDLISGVYPESTGTYVMTFTKNSSFNAIRYGVNGTQIDTTMMLNVGHLVNGETYTLSFNILNLTQGSFAWNNIQLEQGAVATEYEPYIDKTIYIKNNKGFYEELYGERNLQNYLPGEQKIGTWINSKPLYRKVIYNTNTTDLTVSAYVADNIDMLYVEGGYLYHPSDKIYRCIDYAGCYKDGNNVIIQKGNANWASFETYLIVRYTKTTD